MSYLHPGAGGELDLLGVIDLPFYDRWSPKVEGERVSGRVAYRRVETWYDQPTDVLYVDTEDGHVKVVTSSVVLARLVAEGDPQPGATVHFRFDGKAQSTSGNTYNRFSFVAEA